MRIQESGENYLETILKLHNRSGFVRSIDIANELEFTKPSVSRAMSILKKEEYITMERSGQILLTQKGLEKANEVYERHRIIASYLIQTLGLDEEIADKDACRIEHVISPETFEKMKAFMKKHESN
jgi:DtxR family Mn-dependent transcriptional regulator